MKQIIFFLLLALCSLSVSAQAPGKKCPVCGLSIPKCLYKGRLFAIILFLFSMVSGYSQELTVKSFELLPTDLIARTEPRNDLNDRPCAVIRVGIALQGVVFDGNTIGKPVYNTGEYLVYVTEGSRQITIRHDSYVPLAVNFPDYGVQRVESGCAYRLTVLTGSTPSQTQQSKGGFLVMNVTPTSSRVSIDNGGATATESDGTFKIFLKNGTHSYRVEAGDAYSSVSGTVEMKGERITIPVTLQSVRASLSIKATTSGTQIYVNEEFKGADRWKGELTPGTYLVEAKKDGHRPFSTTVSLAKQQSETITIPALQASYGSLLVDYKPVDAAVYLDNTLLGKSPDVFSNVLVGKHSIKICKEGYTDYTGSVTVEENQQATVSGSLTKGANLTGSVASIIVKGVTFNMIKVDGGTFTMGATKEMKKPGRDEKPTHQVTLSSYYIGETEVTQALWKAVMGSNPSHWQGGDLPVEKVSWNDCQEFIRKLNEMTKRRFRLPTEAEWEFAARGGNKSRHTQYSGSSKIDEVAWYDGNSGGKTHPVKTKKANELGIYDMSGNVGEWCQDWYGSYSSRAETNPTGATSGTNRVYRGGGWDIFAGYCRSSYRDRYAPGIRFINLGFRLVLSE